MVQEFLQSYLLDPLISSQVAQFNAVNTLVYASIGIILLFFAFKLFLKTGIEINSKFFWTILSFTPLGVCLSILHDAKALPSQIELFGIATHPFILPFVFATTFLIIIATLAILKLLQIKFKFELFSYAAAIGTILSASSAIALFSKTGIHNPIIFFALIPPLVLVAIYLFFKPDKFQIATLFSQTFDATTTFFAISFFNYGEQQFFSNAIISIGGPALFFLIKTAIAATVCVFAKREIEDRRAYIYILCIITVFGFAPGLKNLLRILVGI